MPCAFLGDIIRKILNAILGPPVKPEEAYWND